MDRRGFLVLSGSGLAGAVVTAIPEPIARGLDGAHIGDPDVALMYSRLEGLWHLDDRHGGGACLPSALGDLQMAFRMLRQARFTGGTERQIYRLIASLARFAGWAAFDSGQHAAAQQLWHAALRAADQGGDTSQSAYILSNLALQSVYVERGRCAVAQLEAARAITDPSQRILHSVLDCWQARAHGARGEPRSAARLLNRADDMWGNRRPGDDMDEVYWMPRPTLTSEAGTTMMECGDYATADRMLTEGYTDRLVGARDRTLYLVRRTELGIRTSRLDEAYDHGQAAITAVGEAGIDSHRLTQRIDLMLDQFPGNDPRTSQLRGLARTQRQQLVPAA